MEIAGLNQGQGLIQVAAAWVQTHTAIVTWHPTILTCVRAFDMFPKQCAGASG